MEKKVFINRYNYIIVPTNFTRIDLHSNEFFKPYGKNDLLQDLKQSRPINTLFQLVSGDIDLSKMKLTDRINFIRNNPDVEEKTNEPAA